IGIRPLGGQEGGDEARRLNLRIDAHRLVEGLAVQIGSTEEVEEECHPGELLCLQRCPDPVQCPRGLAIPRVELHPQVGMKVVQTERTRNDEQGSHRPVAKAMKVVLIAGWAAQREPSGEPEVCQVAEWVLCPPREVADAGGRVAEAHAWSEHRRSLRRGTGLTTY